MPGSRPRGSSSRSSTRTTLTWRCRTTAWRRASSCAGQPLPYMTRKGAQSNPIQLNWAQGMGGGQFDAVRFSARTMHPTWALGACGAANETWKMTPRSLFWFTPPFFTVQGAVGNDTLLQPVRHGGDQELRRRVACHGRHRVHQERSPRHQGQVQGRHQERRGVDQQHRPGGDAPPPVLTRPTDSCPGSVLCPLCPGSVLCALCSVLCALCAVLCVLPSALCPLSSVLVCARRPQH